MADAKQKWQDAMFGRLTVLGEPFRLPVGRNGLRAMHVVCRCRCGVVLVIATNRLSVGKSKSCGCLRNERSAERGKQRLTTHGGWGTRLYKAWESMFQRCENPKCKSYPDYGGRGIVICQQWREGFENFRNWAMTAGYADNLTLDRIKNELGYHPDNCRWVPMIVQASNKRSNHLIFAFGECKSVAEWTRDPRCRVPKSTILNRIKRGISGELLLTAKEIVHHG